MIGLFFFYAGLFESNLEKKVTVYIQNIIPRNNKLINFLNIKKLNNYCTQQKFQIIVNKKIRNTLRYNY
jgi:hypothetical protein